MKTLGFFKKRIQMLPDRLVEIVAAARYTFGLLRILFKTWTKNSINGGLQ